MTTACPIVPLTDEQRRLVERNLSLAKHLLRGLRLPPGMDADDALQSACVGLAEAGRRFDPARGVPFGGFARFCIRSAVFGEFRRWRRRSAAVAFADPATLDRESGAKPVDAAACDRDAALWLLRGLPKRLRGVVTDHMNGLSCALIGRRVGLTRQQARNLLLGALDDIRARKAGL
jgi:RNA polymerase sigma factor (sigma-70 family)